ncbi:MAG: sugar transferase [Fimbriimonadaceae bacterium]|nr:sugar transferase [Fimbriimonadaceae bacterium]
MQAWKGAGWSHPQRLAPVAVEPVLLRYRRWKRVIDLVGALLLILALSPIFLVVAALIKLTSRGPLFYVSRRVGMNGVVFNFYKFRSMYMDAEARKAALAAQNEQSGPIFKMKNDPRITPVGRFIRKFSLDELPQIFSVLKGDMSLVGPRPQLESEVACYSRFDRERMSVRPGLTCYWQIMGRSDLSFEEWMMLDHRYLRQMSFWEDLRILVRTPRAVISGKGAY